MNNRQKSADYSTKTRLFFSHSSCNNCYRLHEIGRNFTHLFANCYSNITAMMFGTGFKRTILISILISMTSVVIGIFLSYMVNSAPSGTIALISISVFLLVYVGKYLIKKHSNN